MKTCVLSAGLINASYHVPLSSRRLEPKTKQVGASGKGRRGKVGGERGRSVHFCECVSDALVWFCFHRDFCETAIIISVRVLVHSIVTR